mmetsp:Transcript_8098/g.13085  ORF Transcript_8098/g.13085 Transcript_8098/m.13085 type:complete len:146 (+) Transcript_8098:932-1369(+)
MENCKVIGRVELENVGSRAVSTLHGSQFRGEVSVKGEGMVDIKGSNIKAVTCGLCVSWKGLSVTCSDSSIYGIMKSHDINSCTQSTIINSKMGHGYRSVPLLDLESDKALCTPVALHQMGPCLLWAERPQQTSILFSFGMLEMAV